MGSATANLIRNSRLERDISQLDISKKLGFTTPQYLSNIERELVELSPKRFKEVARAIGIQPQAILYAHLKDYEMKIRKMAKL